MRLLVLSLFALVCVLALAVAGILDWITGVLFLILEILAEVLRRLFFRHDRPRRHLAARPLAGTRASHSAKTRKRRFVRRKTRPAGLLDLVESQGATPSRRRRVLVPITRDEPDLIAFALEECCERRAELLLLFIRPLMVMPMGPNPYSGLKEDDEARDTLDRTVNEARVMRVPVRPFYEVSHDQAATILEVAQDQEADVVLVSATRRSRVWGALMGDLIQSIQAKLPGRASLMIHGS